MHTRARTYCMRGHRFRVAERMERGNRLWDGSHDSQGHLETGQAWIQMPQPARLGFKPIFFKQQKLSAVHYVPSNDPICERFETTLQTVVFLYYLGV